MLHVTLGSFCSDGFVHLYFSLRDINMSLPPETHDVAAHDSGDKRVQSTEPDIMNGSILQLIYAHICVRVSD